MGHVSIKKKKGNRNSNCEQKELFPGNGDVCPGFAPEGGWLIWEIQDLQSQPCLCAWPGWLWCHLRRVGVASSTVGPGSEQAAGSEAQAMSYSQLVSALKGSWGWAEGVVRRPLS